MVHIGNRETYSQIVGTRLKMDSPQEDDKNWNILWYPNLSKRPMIEGTEDSSVNSTPKVNNNAENHRKILNKSQKMYHLQSRLKLPIRHNAKNVIERLSSQTPHSNRMFSKIHPKRKT